MVLRLLYIYVVLGICVFAFMDLNKQCMYAQTHITAVNIQAASAST